MHCTHKFYSISLSLALLILNSVYILHLHNLYCTYIILCICINSITAVYIIILLLYVIIVTFNNGIHSMLCITSKKYAKLCNIVFYADVTEFIFIPCTCMFLCNCSTCVCTYTHNHSYILFFGLLAVS